MTPEIVSSDAVAGPTAETEQALPTAMEWLPTSAIDDGTQAVLHDAYDVQVYNEALQSYSRLPETLQKVQERLSTAPALIRDVFNSVYKRLPTLCAPTEMSPAYMHNREMVEQMMSTVEWRRLRQAETIADEVASTLATIGLVPGIVSALDPRDLELINRARQLQERADSLFDRADALSDLSDLVAPANAERSEHLRSQAEQVQQDAAEAKRQAAQVDAELERGAHERQDAVRRAARQAAQQAEEQVDQAAAALKAFTGGTALRLVGSAQAQDPAGRWTRASGWRLPSRS